MSAHGAIILYTVYSTLYLYNGRLSILLSKRQESVQCVWKWLCREQRCCIWLVIIYFTPFSAPFNSLSSRLYEDTNMRKMWLGAGEGDSQKGTESWFLFRNCYWIVRGCFVWALWFKHNLQVTLVCRLACPVAAFYVVMAANWTQSKGAHSRCPRVCALALTLATS